MKPHERQTLWRNDAQRLRTLGAVVLAAGIIIAALQLAPVLGLLGGGFGLLESVLILVGPIVTVLGALVVRAVLRGLASLIEIAWFNLEANSERPFTDD